MLETSQKNEEYRPSRVRDFLTNVNITFWLFPYVLKLSKNLFKLNKFEQSDQAFFWKMVSGLFKPSLNIIFCRIFEQILLLKVFLFVYSCLSFKWNFNNAMLYSILGKIFLVKWIKLHSKIFTDKMNFFFEIFDFRKTQLPVSIISNYFKGHL